MSRKEETLTYKQNMSKTEVFHVIKAIGCPLIVNKYVEEALQNAISAT